MVRGKHMNCTSCRNVVVILSLVPHTTCDHLNKRFNLCVLVVTWPVNNDYLQKLWRNFSEVERRVWCEYSVNDKFMQGCSLFLVYIKQTDESEEHTWNLMWWSILLQQFWNWCVVKKKKKTLVSNSDTYMIKLKFLNPYTRQLTFVSELI